MSILVLRESWKRLPADLRGMLWLLVSGALFAAMAAFIKYLGGRLPSVELVFFRSSFQLAILLPLLLRAGPAGLRTRRPGLMALRCAMAAVAVNAGFYAFTVLPLADAVAISFTRTLFVTVLAILILGERVGVHRWTATVVGFAGVLLMLRPGLGGFEPAALLALLAAAMVAGLSISVRLLSRTESNAAMMAYPAGVILLVTAWPLAEAWVAPSPEEWALILAMSAVGFGGQWCIIQAYRVGEASALAPVSYLRLIFAILIGLFVFAEVPDTVTLAGSAIIVAASLYTARREARRGRSRPRAAASPTDGQAPLD